MMVASCIPQAICTSLTDRRTPPCGIIKQHVTAKQEGPVYINYTNVEASSRADNGVVYIITKSKGHHQRYNSPCIPTCLIPNSRASSPVRLVGLSPVRRNGVGRKRPDSASVLPLQAIVATFNITSP